MRGYWTVLIPWVPVQFRTEWHPREATGAFSLLSRGSFTTVGAAIVWAKEKLNGAPYTVKFVPPPAVL